MEHVVSSVWCYWDCGNLLDILDSYNTKTGNVDKEFCQNDAAFHPSQHLLESFVDISSISIIYSQPPERQRVFKNRGLMEWDGLAFIIKRSGYAKPRFILSLQ